MAKAKAEALRTPLTGEVARTPSKMRRAAVAFCLTFFGLMGGVYLWTGLLTSMRSEHFDFAALADDQRLLVHGLTRQQGGGLKIGYIEAHEPPRVGLFGNHQLQYVRTDLFGDGYGRGDFFNFWFANLALPELHDTLLHLERIGKLPTETILIQMTTPNNDNGRYVIGYSGELPFDLMFNHLSDPVTELSVSARAWETMLAKGEALFAHLKYRLDLFSIMSVPVSLNLTGLDQRVIKLSQCDDAAEHYKPARIDGLLGAVLRVTPPIIRDPVVDRINQKGGGAAASAQRFCSNRNYIAGALRFDGARSAEHRWNDKELKRDENPLKNWSVDLQRDDDAIVVRHVAGMAEIARRNGLKFALVIPPVFETERRSVVNEIANRALAQLPGVHVADGRGYRGDPEMFLNYDHPSDKYVRALSAELKKAGILAK